MLLITPVSPSQNVLCGKMSTLEYHSTKQAKYNLCCYYQYSQYQFNQVSHIANVYEILCDRPKYIANG